jgi:hypothetical protein
LRDVILQIAADEIAIVTHAEAVVLPLDIFSILLLTRHA